MEYLKSKDNENINLTIMLIANFNTNYTPKQLSNELSNGDYIVDNYKSSRSMYPDKELVGVKFDKRGISGEIYSDKIKIKLSFYDTNKMYSILSNWFSNTNIKIPPKDKFYIQSIIISSKTKEIYLDDTKTKHGTRVFEETDVTAVIRELADFIFIEFDDIEINKGKQLFESVFDEEYIIIN